LFRLPRYFPTNILNVFFAFVMWPVYPSHNSGFVAGFYMRWIRLVEWRVIDSHPLQMYLQR
jgi:hypothetical protein